MIAHLISAALSNTLSRMASNFRVNPYTGYKFHDWVFKGRSSTGVIESMSRDSYIRTGATEPLRIGSAEETNQMKLSEVVELMSLNSMSRTYAWNDLHRYVWHFVKADQKETIQNFLDFAEIYGDLFIKGFSIDISPRPNLAGWSNEVQLIGAHARLAEGGNHDLFSKPPAETIAASGLDEQFNEAVGSDDTHKPLLLQRLDEYCSTNIVDVSRDGSKKRNYQTIYEHHNLAGFLWLLVARDAADGITYSLCPTCQVREVPSRTPSGKPAKRCTDNCNLKASRSKEGK